MRRFLVGVPAHLFVEVEARSEEAARRAVKEWESLEFSVPLTQIAGRSIARKVVRVVVGKHAVGSDPIEEVGR